ncbi:MAG TPA: hypothetical protein VMY88_01060 [Acidimicrobiales bacterium]|nr:hypothetical protein [Acidimicrobiales bacterium]
MSSKRIWLLTISSDGSPLVARTAGISLRRLAVIRVRKGDAPGRDGIWLGDERSPDTSIIIDDHVAYTSPRDRSDVFDAMEAQGTWEVLEVIDSQLRLLSNVTAAGSEGRPQDAAAG